MTTLSEILDPDLLAAEVAAGYISARKHPEFPSLVIYNYTEKVQFERRWNDATRMSRGLIVDHADEHRVLARPFGKFHNWDEPEAPGLDFDAPLYHWSNKEDGSLGILYRRPDGILAIATRGSFESEQAKWATAHWWATYGKGAAHGQSEVTFLMEIIYPENRIVLDYGAYQGLIPLGTITNATGMFIPAPDRVGEKRTLRELLLDLSRSNAEGWVAWKNEYTAVKIKQADYIELHRIVTGLNRKSVWREVVSNGTPEELIEKVPDELHEWVREVADELHTAYRDKARAIEEWYNNAVDYTWEPGEDFDRKEFALYVARNVPTEYRGYMFTLLDGRDISAKLWASLEPSGGGR